MCLGFEGKTSRVETVNSSTHHAEEIALRTQHSIDRLVVYRFNRQDPDKQPRTSCPCWSCVPLILASGVRKVEYMSPLGPVQCKIGDLKPYNRPYIRPASEASYRPYTRPGVVCTCDLTKPHRVGCPKHQVLP